MKDPELLALGKAKLNEGILAMDFWDYALYGYMGVMGCLIVYFTWETFSNRKNAKDKRS